MSYLSYLIIEPGLEMPGLNAGRPMESASCVHYAMTNSRFSDTRRYHRDGIVTRRGQL